jgi:DNA recombination protein RmuC
MEISPFLTTILVVTALSLVLLCGGVAYVLVRSLRINRALEDTRQTVSEQLKSGQIDALKHAQEQVDRMSQRMQEMQNALNERLDGQRQLLSQQLTDSGKTVADLKKEIGSLSEATGKIFELGRDIASLEDILSSPKLRGGVGEILLERLLAEVFPPHLYSMQYSFADGTMVDAVIRIGDRLVPIDSKFPIEDFRRVLESDESERSRSRRQFLANVRKKVDEIATKYILPDENTFDFALMYIPAENVYYETIVREEAAGEGDGLGGMLGYAVERHVIPVSPNTFYAYLQVILFGLKGMELEQRGNEILSQLRRLGGDLEKFSDEYDKLGTHLVNARGAYDRGDRKLGGLAEKLRSLESAPPPSELPGGEPG